MTLNGIHCKLARPRLSAVMTAWVRSPAFSFLINLDDKTWMKRGL